METTVLLNGKEVNKFGSGSMKGIDQTALEGFGLIPEAKKGGKPPAYDVLVKWVERVIELAKKNLETAGANAGGTLSASIGFGDIDLSAKEMAVTIVANSYWKYIDQGVRGKTSSEKAPRSKFKYKDKFPPAQAMADWLSNKSKVVEPTYSRELKRMRTKQEQALVDGRSVAYWVYHRGIKPTNFMSNALTPEMIDALVNSISETLGKSISLSTRL